METVIVPNSVQNFGVIVCKCVKWGVGNLREPKRKDSALPTSSFKNFARLRPSGFASPYVRQNFENLSRRGTSFTGGSARGRGIVRETVHGTQQKYTGCSVFINKAGDVVRSGASRPPSHSRYGNRRSGAPNLGRRESGIVIV